MKCHDFVAMADPFALLRRYPCFLHTGLAVPGRFAGREYATAARPRGCLFI